MKITLPGSRPSADGIARRNTAHVRAECLECAEIDVEGAAPDVAYRRVIARHMAHLNREIRELDDLIAQRR
jgi:hypothetical protein